MRISELISGMSTYYTHTLRNWKVSTKFKKHSGYDIPNAAQLGQEEDTLLHVLKQNVQKNLLEVVDVITVKPRQITLLDLHFFV